MPASPQLTQELDSAVRTGLISLRDAYFHWLLYSTALVVVGVILEGVEFLESWAKRHSFDSWVKGISKFAWILIVLGVAGEGVFESFVSYADGLVQEFNDTLLQAAQRATADADARSKEVSGALEIAKEQLIGKQISLEKEAQATARAQKETARAQKETAGAQLAVKEYVDRIVKIANPRNLDRTRFIEILRDVPNGRAEVMYAPDDDEARSFAQAIHSALGPNGAGWNVRAIGPLASNPLTGTAGVSIAVRMVGDEPRNDDDDLPIREELFKAIHSGDPSWVWNIPDWRRPIRPMPDRIFVINVGHHILSIPLWIPPWQRGR
jgi:hypothetical protein